MTIKPAALEDALDGFATARRSDRPQQIHTPDEILQVCRAMWGRIRMDPCASSERSTGADVNLCGMQVDTGRKRRDGKTIWRWEGEGLRTLWIPGSYINPPFEDLDAWMSYAITQRVEWILLAPVRTHRSWWIQAAGLVDRIAWLKPFCFHGFEQTFPVPCALLYQGPNALAFEREADALSVRITGPLL